MTPTAKKPASDAQSLENIRGSRLIFNRLLAVTFVLAVAVLWMLPASLSARPRITVSQYVREFEASYQGVRTLTAEFTQTYFAWGRTRKESGTVYFARGQKMRWVYHQPEEKIFLSNGKQLFLYVPSEKQVTISSMHDIEDARVPLDLLLSHMKLSRAFSRVEFADQALTADRGDRVIRGFPQSKFKGDYRSVLIELSPQFDIRRLIVFYPDNSTMQFAFANIERNKPLDPSLFTFSPPPGTQTIHQ